MLLCLRRSRFHTWPSPSLDAPSLLDRGGILPPFDVHFIGVRYVIMNNFYVVSVLLVPIHDCLKRLWIAVEHRHIQTLSTPHTHSPVGHPPCFLSFCIELCPLLRPTIVFSFSKYSFAVPPDVYLESPPNIQPVETSSRQITRRIIFVIISIIIIIVHSFQNPVTFHRLRVHFNVFVQNSYAFTRGEH